MITAAAVIDALVKSEQEKEEAKEDMEKAVKQEKLSCSLRVSNRVLSSKQDSGKYYCLMTERHECLIRNIRVFISCNSFVILST